MAEIVRLTTSGEAKSVTELADRLSISRPTIRRLMEQVGIIGGPANQHKPGGFTVRTARPETKGQRRDRLSKEARERQAARAALDRAEREAKAEAKREAARLAAAVPITADPSPPQPRAGPDPGAPEFEAAPSEPVIPAAKASTGGRGKPKARGPAMFGQVVAGPPAGALPWQPGDAYPPDMLGAFAIPADFDPEDRLRKLAAAPWIDPTVNIAALRILVGITKGKGRIDWTSVTPEQIPEEMRHRLAGMLLPWIDFAELPEVVRSAPVVCRAVYKLTGILPQRAEDADVVMARWEAMRGELRTLAGEIQVPTVGKAEPIALELAAEVAYTAPQWDEQSGN